MHAWGLTACLTLELFPVLQPLCWCCVECAIHHEWDVRKEQHSDQCTSRMPTQGRHYLLTPHVYGCEKCLIHSFSMNLFVVRTSSFKPLLSCTRFWSRCWAAIQLSHCPDLSGHAVHEEVDGLHIGRQHG